MDPNKLIDKISECMQKLQNIEDYIHAQPIVVAEIGEQKLVTHSSDSNEAVSIHKKILENVRRKVNEYRLQKRQIPAEEGTCFE